jgi:hypothetical protein
VRGWRISYKTSKEMLEPRWVVAGVILGMLIATVIVPPTRKIQVLPQPRDESTFQTDTGCVRFVSEEVPCTAEPDSLNLLANR